MEQFLTISGQPVSRFSFGTMQFGGTADEAASGQLYRACRAAGITFFDTAYIYTEGRSERILGDLIAAERDDIFLATKCAYRGASAGEIEAQFSESRRRLKTDVVDLLYIHRWDEAAPLAESLAVLAGYVSTGSVRYVGVSNFAAWQVMKAVQIGADLGLAITFLQPMYSLVKRQAEVEILPMARSEDFAVCPYSPLGGGLLTGKYAAGGSGRLATDTRYASRYREDWMHGCADALCEVAADLGVAPATLAVAWVARHEGVFGPIISGRSVDQVKPSLAGMNFEMDDALYDRLSSLSPTPPPATDRTEVV